MAVKSKTSLKEVFAGIASVMFQSEKINLASGTASIAPEFDLPVHVDDLSINQDEPDLNHYKVHGLNADWVSTATAGDVTINIIVPTLHNDIMGWAFGDGTSVSATVTESAALVDGTFTGQAFGLNTRKITGSLILLNEAKDKLFVIANAALWPSLVYENGSTDPIAVRLSGTIEASEVADICLLKKTATA